MSRATAVCGIGPWGFDDTNHCNIVKNGWLNKTKKWGKQITNKYKIYRWWIKLWNCEFHHTQAASKAEGWRGKSGTNSTYWGRKYVRHVWLQWMSIDLHWISWIITANFCGMDVFFVFIMVLCLTCLYITLAWGCRCDESNRYAPKLHGWRVKMVRVSKNTQMEFIGQ